MAGPDLTPETFARGLFRIPPRGGGPSNPQVSYGNWGVFPEMDYQGIDDAVEIWWDPTIEAEDERGAMGTGAWRRSNEGARFTIDGAPPPKPFTDPDVGAHDRRGPRPRGHAARLPAARGLAGGGRVAVRRSRLLSSLGAVAVTEGRQNRGAGPGFGRPARPDMLSRPPSPHRLVA